MRPRLLRGGLTFRATKDLDIVLCIEALDAAFVRAFWAFAKLGGYEIQESSTGQKRLYRFRKPRNDMYPVMLELFARVPDALGEVAGRLTPIPVADEVSSLSAILLDPAYHDWICAGKVDLGGLSVLRPEHLIPVKAKAWLDLRQRAAGGRVDRHPGCAQTQERRVSPLCNPRPRSSFDPVRSNEARYGGIPHHGAP